MREVVQREVFGRGASPQVVAIVQLLIVADRWQAMISGHGRRLVRVSWWYGLVDDEDHGMVQARTQEGRKAVIHIPAAATIHRHRCCGGTAETRMHLRDARCNAE